MWLTPCMKSKTNKSKKRTKEKDEHKKGTQPHVTPRQRKI